ncbi:hypothetical protein EsH8_I_001117 [Colletotrichum jinshuiense]
MKASRAGLAAITVLLGQSEAFFFRPLFLPLPLLTVGSGGGGGGGGGGGTTTPAPQQSCPTPSCARQSCPPPSCLPLTDPTPYGSDIADCQTNGIPALFKQDGSWVDCAW